ncbi:DUF397 domain-containing protein [Streptomyces atratus]|uniref:DUF397 domain-containing protein n=1 Tax=Streptomyces atratus TaxID=1893 RepID=A0A2Z5JBT7_STRAR|nr:DUF397 domain-containing protein [Streptomyces atratus]AXE77750.1 hypothetical protein C5746_13260 [Streptomyces atratus]
MHSLGGRRALVRGPGKPPPCSAEDGRTAGRHRLPHRQLRPRSGAARRKSSYSRNTGGECVEVADGLPCAVPVRDSENPDGPVLTIGADAWRAFVDGLV